ncbi:MAG: type II CRISPR-associated endonuclease Cas1, partial [Bacillota bacterium]|nr:type II CRISPR-associated endonuclease Cas1 [Bacillota bacterium]
MSFRILEITNPAEIHILNHQLEIQSGKNKIYIPIKDLDIVICQGPNIRLSTNDITILAQNKVLLMTLGNNYLPSSMTLSYENNVRQTLVIQKQLTMSQRRKNILWKQIIIRKIENQARALTLLGKEGAKELYLLSAKVRQGDKSNIEGQAAQKYFQYLYPGLNRRCETPINSCLNYGYSILRSAIAKYAGAHGFLLSNGIHHKNTFNAFNLVDDLIEPFRPIVDMVATKIVSNNLTNYPKNSPASISGEMN